MTTNSFRKQIYEGSFTPGALEIKWTCTCGKTVPQKKGKGWTNLWNHKIAVHQDYEKTEHQSTLIDYVSSPVENVFGWIDWITDCLYPFSFVENETNRKYRSLKPISRNTPQKYMIGSSAKVESEDKDKLKGKFCILMDGLSKGSTHYVALFAALPDSKVSAGYSTVLLSFSPLYDETNLNADEHSRFIKWVVQNLNGKNMETYVISITGDNCKVNKS